MLCINIINKSFRLNDLLHKFREGLPFKFSSFGAIVDHTRIKIHLYLIPLINALACFRTLNDRKSNVDCISVKKFSQMSLR